MINYRFMCPAVCCLLLGASPAVATTYYVDVKIGADRNDGIILRSPFRTIQKAADLAAPGDTVVVMPGLYYEHVQVTRRGTPERPITFMADAVEKDRVIITGADPTVREKKIRWTLNDEDLLMFSIPFDGPHPSRILSGRADLYPYGSLSSLRRLVWEERKDKAGRTVGDAVGPPHSYFFDADAKRLYVRLERHGAYGAADPNEQTMCVSPPPGGQYDGTAVKHPSHYNFGILGVGHAHVVIDGFTCETPGVCGVYAQSSSVTVRNCWFYGCRAGVSGTARETPSPEDPEAKDYYTANYNPDFSRTSNNVTIEYCEFTQYPTYSEASYWARKITYDMKLKYEIGIASAAAKDWEIRHCYVHDVFDGLASQGSGNSWGLKVHDNRFEGLVDNAVEAEDHARDLWIYRNVVVDCYHSPFSWQPLKGEPWPGPIYAFQNVLYNTPEHYRLYRDEQDHPMVKSFPPQNRGKVSEASVNIPAPGFLIFNNTMIRPKAALVLGRSEKALGYHFYNNIIAMDKLDLLDHAEWPSPSSAMEFRNNLCAPISPYALGPAGAAGEGGRMMKSLSEFGFVSPSQRDGDYHLRPQSPAVGRSILVPNAPVQFKDIGAVQTGDTWYPPVVGPQRRPTDVTPSTGR